MGTLKFWPKLVSHPGAGVGLLGDWVWDPVAKINHGQIYLARRANQALVVVVTTSPEHPGILDKTHKAIRDLQKYFLPQNWITVCDGDFRDSTVARILKGFEGVVRLPHFGNEIPFLYSAGMATAEEVAIGEAVQSLRVHGLLLADEETPQKMEIILRKLLRDKTILGIGGRAVEEAFEKGGIPPLSKATELFLREHLMGSEEKLAEAVETANRIVQTAFTRTDGLQLSIMRKELERGLPFGLLLVTYDTVGVLSTAPNIAVESTRSRKRKETPLMWMQRAIESQKEIDQEPRGWLQ